MPSLYRLFAEKLGGSDSTSFKGSYGDVFYDPITGALRISDGSTPGGILLGALGSTGYVGTFFDTTTQTNPVANVERLMTYDTIDIADGVTVENGSRLKVLHTGNYNIQFSAQLDKTDAGADDVYIWLKKNGTNVDQSAGLVTLTGNDDRAIAAWNYVVTAVANDYFELAWSSADTNLRILALPASSNPTKPAIPSMIVTVCQV